MKTKHLFGAMALTGFIRFVTVMDGYAQSYDFDASQFKSPAMEFAPFARWWWPGNDVAPEELKREINVFADNAFGSVEIQPFTINVPVISNEIRKRVYSWDTPSFYENVGVVMEEALKRGLTVDMNNGSSWPPSGYFLNAEDGFINILHASTQVTGRQNVSVLVPSISNNIGVAPRLIAVLAAKRLPDAANSKTVPLDAASTVLLTSKVTNDSLRWSVPDGDWEIMAFWSRPNSKTGSMTASQRQGAGGQPF
jgi:hypothetical protein